MVTLYVTPSCTSCRKARKWFQENNIPFIERNIMSDPVTRDEIKEILRLTDNGTEEIISTRSKAFQQLKPDLEKLTLQDLLTLIEENPGILKRPIMFDDKRLQVGYNGDEIRSFLPRSVREFNLQEMQKMIN
ncbi:transcriptional regulator SpxA [Oceanobacillus alkalisoli]|uniref:transcriptional regulator SpxA n=1 Tax=Oceanobacillus alkalisoli TaxID=2925113 RepID=UPI001EF05248|nr:transcriptional regulator SpxA [Oceanobacillus alkalisoli]MCF3943204.1 transcriptional regulator SpxA [Oceanobacillus alkalisoli]MCG5103918.1 transcriptional regulator SpxA [Oceanobacillus alkalisoli]